MVSLLRESRTLCVYFLDFSYSPEFNWLLDPSSVAWHCWQEGKFCHIVSTFKAFKVPLTWLIPNFSYIKCELLTESNRMPVGGSWNPLNRTGDNPRKHWNVVCNDRDNWQGITILSDNTTEVFQPVLCKLISFTQGTFPPQGYRIASLMF